MDRLTIPDVRVDEHTTRRSVIDVEAVREHAMKIYWRLKQYEDTKRTPEQIEALEAAIMGKAVAQITEFEGLPIARLRELAVADKDGRVVVLPCKVGDTVYTIVQVFGDDGVRPRIIEKKITGIGGNALNKVWMVNKGNKYEDRFSPSEFGRSVFLTREEAEKALAEMVGEKDG